MATQTVEFTAPSGMTLTAIITAIGSDTITQTAGTVTEATNRKGTYTATFTDAAAATYKFSALSGTVGVAVWGTTLAAGTATYQVFELANVTAWNGTAPNNLASGRVDGYLGATAAGVLVAGSYADGWLETQSVGAVVGSVGGVTATVTADITRISGDTTAADNAEAFFDGTGYAGTNNVIPTVTTLTNLPAITANWLTAAGTAADFGTEVGAAVLSALGTGTWATAIPWNASWDAEVQSEVDDALIVKGLDHLVFTSVVGADIADNSIIARMASKSATADWDSYDNTTDSHEATRDAITNVGASLAVTANVASRVNGDTLRAFVGESVTFTVYPLDSDGVAVDTSAMTLSVTTEDGKRTDLEVIANASITKTATYFRFTTAAATSNVRELTNGRWSCRRTDTNVVIVSGPYIVDYAP